MNTMTVIQVLLSLMLAIVEIWIVNPNSSVTAYRVTELELSNSSFDIDSAISRPEDTSGDISYEIVYFGHYEQDGDPENGTEDIEWFILATDEQENRTLLLSRYGLAVHNFDSTNREGVLWYNCLLRQWLNQTFLQEAFNEYEIRYIEPSSISSPVYIGSNLESDTDQEGTKDCVFLLSYQEIERFFPSALARRCKPTTVAKKELVVEAIITSVDGVGFDLWFTRTVDKASSNMVIIYDDGTFGIAPSWIEIQVRPAIWVNNDGLTGLICP